MKVNLCGGIVAAGVLLAVLGAVPSRPEPAPIGRDCRRFLHRAVEQCTAHCGGDMVRDVRGLTFDVATCQEALCTCVDGGTLTVSAH